MLTTLRLERIADVEVQMTRLFQPSRVVRQERELALVVDAEAVRAAARHVVEADLAWACRGLLMSKMKKPARALRPLSPASRSEFT